MHCLYGKVKDPPIKYLQSQMPFCVDTLRFEQWLQFVLIERLKGLIKANLPLPGNFFVSPMAEEAFKPLGKKAEKVIGIVNQLDQLLNTQVK